MDYQDAKEGYFKKEEDILLNAKHVASEKKLPLDMIYGEYEKLTQDYQNLLSDLRFLAYISDKHQSRLHTLKEELTYAKNDLERIVEDRTRELNLAYTEMLATNAELDLFVYRASHDLRGPLASLLGLCYLANLEISEENALNYFKMIHTTSTKMDTVLSKLLTVNNVKHFLPEYLPVSILNFIKDIKQKTDSNENFRQAEVLYGTIDDFMIESDPKILEILFINMLESAAHNLPDYETQISPIYIDVFKEGDYAKFLVRYQGIEITPDYRIKLFDMFHRPNEKPSETGLNLYTAKKAAEKLNGTTSLLSSDRNETIFEISLPLKP